MNLISLRALSKAAVFLSFVFSSELLWAQAFQSQVSKKGASSSELQNLYNKPTYNQPKYYSRALPDFRPTPEVTDYKYVLFSSEAGFSEASNLRFTIAKNLPEGVKLVVLVDSSDVDYYKQQYQQYISLDRVIFATSNDIRNGFWARDAFPFPVQDSLGQLSLVQAEYFRDFRAGTDIANTLNLNNEKNQFTFVGGNLLADQNANCFSVRSSRMFDTTEADLKNAYGCKTTTLLPHVSGIGDVDEVLKPLPNNVMLTNTDQYVSTLTAMGYRVAKLPEIRNSYRTYVNSIIVGKTVFMPSYGVPTDQAAEKVYNDLGYQVVMIKSNNLSDNYNGSVHCQVMAYPAIEEARLLRLLNLSQVR